MEFIYFFRKLLLLCTAFVVPVDDDDDDDGAVDIYNSSRFMKNTCSKNEEDFLIVIYSAK